MQRFKIYFVGLIIIYLGGSCEDPYNPKDINSNAKIPVIEGIIQEGKVPVVKLSWSLGYREEVRKVISDAQLTVADDLGDSINLEETSPGYYTSFSNTFKGIQGRTYTLNIKLPDGNNYVSTPEYLKNRSAIDSVYANPSERTIYTYNFNNEPTPELQEGLNVLSDFSANTDTSLYFRFHTNVLREMNYTEDVNTLAAHVVYIWDSYVLDNTYSVNLTVLHNHRQILPQNQVGFLQYYHLPAEKITRSPTYIMSWVLSYNIYSISRTVYDYYNSIAGQLNANDELFAPVPAQIKSNISCRNNPEQGVIGVFEASSVTTIYKAFSWMSLTKYKSLKLDSFPDTLTTGSSSKFTPDWWISF